MEAETDPVVLAVEEQLREGDLAGLDARLERLSAQAIVDILERLGPRDRAVAYRLLPKDMALEVFEALHATLQRDLVAGLKDEEVAFLFADMDPDDRVVLIDELPAVVARRLLQGLPPDERSLTSEVLGYPHGSIGRRMSPEYVATTPDLTVAETLDRVHSKLADAETVYTLPVVGRERTLVGVVSLRDLLGAAPDTLVEELIGSVFYATATDPAEQSARLCADRKLLALPIVDGETRVVGILTVDDALAILEEAESEDAARISGTEPLRQPYLTTPLTTLVRSRVVWLLVLAIGASLTVQVLGAFEATLDQRVVLTLFIPLLIGTGGNTGNQAATTVTRALALGDLRAGDLGRVFFRELRVGLLLGAFLGAVGLAIVGPIFGAEVGVVIGLTLLCVCTMAATVGGMMPLLARMLRVDPAVFSNPFITTFVDATGLVVYFVIAKTVLGI
jgi:magnesium transporter